TRCGKATRPARQESCRGSSKRVRDMRLTVPFVIGGLLVAAPVGAQDPDPKIVVREVVRDAVRSVHDGAARDVAREIARASRMAYQGGDRGPEQNERFSRRVRIGRDGRVSVQNISGDITVTVGSGDEVSIDAVKRGRDSAQIAATRIVVDERAGRVDVRTEYENTRMFRNFSVSVDYTVTVPSGASVDLKSISGSVKVTGLRGAVRAETVSGNVTTNDTPKVELAKTISGDVTLSGITTEGDLSVSSVSGSVHARNVKAHGQEFGSVSGDMFVSDVTCD